MASACPRTSCARPPRVRVRVKIRVRAPGGCVSFAFAPPRWVPQIGGLIYLNLDEEKVMSRAFKLAPHFVPRLR